MQKGKFFGRYELIWTVVSAVVGGLAGFGVTLYQERAQETRHDDLQSLKLLDHALLRIDGIILATSNGDPVKLRSNCRIVHTLGEIERQEYHSKTINLLFANTIEHFSDQNGDFISICDLEREVALVETSASDSSTDTSDSNTNSGSSSDTTNNQSEDNRDSYSGIILSSYLSDNCEIAKRELLDYNDKIEKWSTVLNVLDAEEVSRLPLKILLNQSQKYAVVFLVVPDPVDALEVQEAVRALDGEFPNEDLKNAVARSVTGWKDITESC